MIEPNFRCFVNKIIMMLALLLGAGCLDDAVQSGDTQSDTGSNLDDSGQDGSTGDQGATDMSQDLDVGSSDMGGDTSPDGATEDMTPDLAPTCEPACSSAQICELESLTCVQCLDNTSCPLDGEVCGDSFSCVCAPDQYRCMTDGSCALRADCDNDPIENLDNAFGMIGLAIFVSPSPNGHDTNNTGLTPDSPVRTVTKAMELAKSLDFPVLLFSGGNYPVTAWNIEAGSTIELIAGGYVADFSARDASAITRFTNSNVVGNGNPPQTLSISNDASIHLANLVLGAAPRSGSAVTLKVDATPVRFTNAIIERGEGSAGTPGVKGRDGVSGLSGQNAIGASPGAGGSNACGGGAKGGDGGTGGACGAADPSVGGPGGGSISNGGNAGVNDCGSINPQPTFGGAGGTGAQGISGGPAQNGTNGGGGGGGGGGGVTLLGTSASDRPNGGGGGGGGCAGTGGTSGGHGGDAIGILVTDAVTLSGTVTFVGGVAGNGGAGGVGGCGGFGGDFGAGQSVQNGIKGGAGGMGGSGGNGGSGNGGNAGRLATIAVAPNATVDVDNLLTTIDATGRVFAAYGPGGPGGLASSICPTFVNAGLDGSNFPDDDVLILP
jgi:hypothetical protein